MQIQRLPATEVLSLDPLIRDYIAKKDILAPFISEFPSLESLEGMIRGRADYAIPRKELADVLRDGYSGLDMHPAVNRNLSLLEEKNSFTITTGHQLCLFTGPLYFVCKILSTIRIARDSQQRFPEYNFIPVYWMASEDHDFQEINHAFLFGKKYEWLTEAGGAVGELSVSTVKPIIEEMLSELPHGTDAGKIAATLVNAYESGSLARATHTLVNELFGHYGLLVLDPSDARLKKHFADTMLREVEEGFAESRVNEVSKDLRDLSYSTQVNPRPVNLFYLEKNARRRIERHGEDFKLSATEGRAERIISRQEMMETVKQHPEVVSPNVVLRPLYQEVLLPNLAYVGGPGELAYWLQLKSVFDAQQTPFPMLVLRDSAMILTRQQLNKLHKLQLSWKDMLRPEADVIRHFANADNLALTSEKEEIKKIFEGIRSLATGVDATLEGAVNAELQKQLSALENMEKRILRAAKQKEDQRIQQYLKLRQDLFPEGGPQERHDNYFQFYLQMGDELMDELLNSFNPFANEVSVLLQEEA